MTALLQTTYFGPIQWYQKLHRYDHCLIEQYDSFQKQTYRNRCVIATANGVQALTVPVITQHPSPNTQHPSPNTQHPIYFPAFEIMMDELRDYRFYGEDMLHPSAQAVEYIWQRFSEMFFSERTQQFLREWQPIKSALAHRPFNPDSTEYQQFLAEARAKEAALIKAYEQR